MQREDLKKYGFEWAWNLEISTAVFDDLEFAADRLRKAEKAVAAARADVRAERKRIEAKIARLWTAEEIAAAKAGQ